MLSLGVRQARFYAVYNKWTKGNHFSRPHFHPNDRYIVVLQGTWWSVQAQVDPANTTPMPAGGFVTHFGKGALGRRQDECGALIMGEARHSTGAEEITPALQIYSSEKFPNETRTPCDRS